MSTTWMVVEDEPNIYEMILAMYNLLGIDGLAFASGEEAMDWVSMVDKGQYGRQLPKMVLMDIRLPGSFSGVDVAVRMRHSRHLRSVPIIMMTAFKLSPSEERDILEVTGAARLIYKPLPPIDEFETMVFEVISSRAS